MPGLIYRNRNEKATLRNQKSPNAGPGRQKRYGEISDTKTASSLVFRGSGANLMKMQKTRRNDPE